MNFDAWSLWKRRGMLVLCGFCAALALPPLDLLPLLIPAFSLWYLLLNHTASLRQAFVEGWWWGMGFFVAGLYWICISLYVEPEKFAWLTPFALLGLPSILSIYTGLAATAYHLLTRRLPSSAWRIFAFVGCFTGAEWLRGYLFTGFPWNLIGYTATASDTLIQAGALLSIYSLGALVVLLATLPALYARKDTSRVPALLGVVLLGSWIAYGQWRLMHYPPQNTTLRLRIVQGDIPQEEKWDPKAAEQTLETYLRLTTMHAETRPQVVIWPEAALPYSLTPTSPLLALLGRSLPPQGLLLTGAIREGNEGAYNSLFAIDATGTLQGFYDKTRLVPFGEFIPFRHLLPLEAIAGGHGDFLRGEGVVSLRFPHLPPLRPLICYEAIFPQDAQDQTHQVRWIVQVTNDAWFGRSSGPYQHLEMARMRAVENGVPLVRAANTGISAVIDPLGRITALLPIGKQGILDTWLPAPLPE